MGESSAGTVEVTEAARLMAVPDRCAGPNVGAALVPRLGDLIAREDVGIPGAFPYSLQSSQ